MFVRVTGDGPTELTFSGSRLEKLWSERLLISVDYDDIAAGGGVEAPEALGRPLYRHGPEVFDLSGISLKRRG